MAADPGQILLYKNDGSDEEDFWFYNVPSISDIGWSRDGYNFIEWNTESDGTGDSYLPGDVLENNGNNPDLYAIWEEILILQKQPVLTYSINWGTGNIFQKLSGKTYVSPSGQTIDCSTLTVTFSSSKHFKKFYATAVKNGNTYGFDNDILVDIRQTNPTGILLYELTERNANTDFNFTINSSSLTAGSGEYRIGLYVQDDDGIWNYEYFLLTSENEQVESSDNLLLQVPVQTSDEEAPNCGFVVDGSALTITDNSKLSDGLINNNDYLMVGCAFLNEEEMEDCLLQVIDTIGTSSLDFRILNEALIQDNYENRGLAVCLTDGNNNYYIPLNNNLLNNIIWGVLIDIGGAIIYVPIIHKNYILETNNILNNMELYGLGYICHNSDPNTDVLYLSFLGNVNDNSTDNYLFFSEIFLDEFENRTIENTYTISNFNFEYPSQE